MRWIARSIIALLVLLPLWFLAVPGLSGLWQLPQSSANGIEQARASTFFPLGSQQWLNFDVPKSSNLFRFYAHAALKPGIADTPVSYTIDYQWLDRDGTVLDRRQHHVTTRGSCSQPDSSDPSGDDTDGATRFYDHQRTRPSCDHALYFLASTQPQASRLRLRVSQMDDDIEEIGVRPFQQHYRPPEKMDLAWQRMSREQRELLSKGALYPSFLLSEFERENLLSSYWRPIGPLGVLDRDYRIGTLYQVDTGAAAVPPDTPAIDGLFAGPQHWVSVVLRDPAGRYRIEWLALPDIGSPRSLQLHWQGVDFEQQRQWQAQVTGQHWEGSLAGGLLQVAPDQPGVMKLYRWQEAAWRDITPQRRYTRAYYCLPDAPLDYRLAPGEESQSLRIDARGFFRQDQPESGGGGRISLHLLDGEGAALYQHVADLSRSSYPYQHFSDAATVPSQVFEPLTSYVDATPESQTLHIECSAPSLVSVYSRPWRHPVKRSLPDQENYWYSFEDRDPAWFTMLPDNVDALIRDKRYHSLVWFFRPLGGDGLLAIGDYSWQALLTDHQEAVEFQVFSAHASDSQSRMEARASAYRPLPEAATVIFAGRSNEKQVRPSAVYLRDSAEPLPVRVLIDQALVLETTVAGRSGRIRLPRLSAGRRHIEIRAEGARWYINHTAQTGQTHLLRSAYSMPPGDGAGSSLTFELDSSGSGQQLGIWLYAPPGQDSLNCRLKLLGERIAGAQPEHSLRDFQYSIAGDQYATAYVMQRRDPGVNGPVRLLVPLKSDLPAQAMTAALDCDQSGVLASAGLISEGLSAYRYFEERHASY